MPYTLKYLEETVIKFFPEVLVKLTNTVLDQNFDDSLCLDVFN